MTELKVGSILMANEADGLPNFTVKGKSYVVSKVHKIWNRQYFGVINEEGESIFPTETSLIEMEESE